MNEFTVCNIDFESGLLHPECTCMLEIVGLFDSLELYKKHADNLEMSLNVLFILLNVG